jgi:hypothetical protein
VIKYYSIALSLGLFPLIICSIREDYRLYQFSPHRWYISMFLTADEVGLIRGRMPQISVSNLVNGYKGGLLIKKRKEVYE